MTATKKRITISSEVVTAIEYDADRTCCVCHEKGRSYQIHHIDGDPANNTQSNLVLLCLLCHSEAERNGGLGRRLTADFLKVARQRWLEQVQFIRQLTGAPQSGARDDAVPSLQHAQPSKETQSLSITSNFDHVPIEKLNLRILLALKQSATNAAAPLLELPAALNPSAGIDLLSNGYRKIFDHIARCYPEHYFGRDGGTKYFDELFGTLLGFELRTALWMRGMMGQYSHCSAGLRALETIDRLLVDTIDLLVSHDSPDGNPSEEFRAWKDEWSKLQVWK